MSVRLDCVYQHIRTGVLYRTLMKSFDVNSQAVHVIYISLNNGQVFNRDEDIFETNFQLLKRNVQSTIKPKEK